MVTLPQRIQQSFGRSRKLAGQQPSQAQLANVEFRLKQIFTPEELARMADNQLVHQVERVWPIAVYVDRKD